MLRQSISILVFLCLFTLGCSSQEMLQLAGSASDDLSADISQNINPTYENAQTAKIDFIRFSERMGKVVIAPGKTTGLFLDVDLNNGTTYHGINNYFWSPFDDLNGVVTWYSNNSSVATISPTGRLTGISEGETTVIASLHNYSAVIRVVVGEVSDAVVSFSFSDDSLDVDTINTVILGLDLVYESGALVNRVPFEDISEDLDCDWSSSDESLATVTEGLVQPVDLRDGSIVVTVDCENFSDDVTINFNLSDIDVSISPVSQLILNDEGIEFVVGDDQQFSVDLHFEDGRTLLNVTDSFDSFGASGELTWESSDPSIASVAGGLVRFLDYGVATIKVSIEGIESSIDLVVRMATDSAQSTEDQFLGDDEIFTTDFGSNSGYGSDDFPNIILGAPAGSLDVLSFGTDGELLIELIGYVIVDGIGPDFTVFENPFQGWEECAQVSVSENGSDFYSFTCDQFDSNEIYEGCAGVTPVASGLSDEDYLNPAISGGDIFDLADLPQPLSTVRFIKITDIGMCNPEGLTSEDLGVPSGIYGGFDMDALAILNGQND